MTRSSLRILVLYDVVESLTRRSVALEAEEDSFITAQTVVSSLRRLQHTVTLLEVRETLYEDLLQRKDAIDLVFNCAEEFDDDPQKGHWVPFILALLRLPFTGASHFAMQLTTDKALTKLVLRGRGIPTPDFQVFRSSHEELQLHSFPLIVKPLFEDGSIGIDQKAVVRDGISLRERVQWVIQTFEEPALVEEYIPGDDLMVSLIGPAHSPLVLPIARVHFENLPQGYYPICSYEYKWKRDSPLAECDKGEAPALISKEIAEQTVHLARQAYEIFSLQDYGRIDFRLSPEGHIFLIEVNTNPCLSDEPDTALFLSATAAGFTYDELVSRILGSARERFGL